MNNDRFLTRVFDKQEKKMLYPGDGYLCIDNESINFGWNVGKNDFRELLFGDRFAPMMCWGLPDKNGELIYENDILNYGNYSDNNKPCNHIVIFDEKQGYFLTQEIRIIDNISHRASIVDNNAIIIGNRWENEKLLEGKVWA